MPNRYNLNFQVVPSHCILQQADGNKKSNDILIDIFQYLTFFTYVILLVIVRNFLKYWFLNLSKNEICSAINKKREQTGILVTRMFPKWNSDKVRLFQQATKILRIICKLFNNFDLESFRDMRGYCINLHICMRDSKWAQSPI